MTGMPSCDASDVLSGVQEFPMVREIFVNSLDELEKMLGDVEKVTALSAVTVLRLKGSAAQVSQIERMASIFGPLCSARMGLGFHVCVELNPGRRWDAMTEHNTYLYANFWAIRFSRKGCDCSRKCEDDTWME